MILASTPPTLLERWNELLTGYPDPRSSSQALGILIASVLVAVVLHFVFKLILRLTARTAVKIDDVIFRGIRTPLFVTILFVGASRAIALMVRDDLRATTTADPILGTIAIILWVLAIGRVCDSLLDALARRIDDFRFVQPRTLPLFQISVKALVIGSALYALFLVWGIDVTAWLASAGIIGLAVGFAAKDTLANLFSGIFILADAPYKLGDFIVLDGGERGRVTDIGIRSTRILTRDDVEIIIPNGVIANTKITNASGGPHEKERVRVDVGVAYGSDIDHVREVLMEIAAGCELLSDQPEPRVRFRKLGDSALEFQLMGWIDRPILRGRTIDDLLVTIYKRFTAEGISIPFPQRDVHLYREE